MHILENKYFIKNNLKLFQNENKLIEMYRMRSRYFYVAEVHFFDYFIVYHELIYHFQCLEKGNNTTFLY